MEAFRIFRHEDLTETYRRVVREQIMLSMDYCRKSDEEPDVATHEIRKSTKRIRAIYRLFREVTGEDAYRQGRERFRTISGLLARHRVSKVHFDTLTRLSEDKRLNVDPKAIIKLVQRVQKSHFRLTNETVSKHKVFGQVSSLLSEEMDRVKNSELSSCNLRMLAENIGKSYNISRKDLKAIQEQYSAENLHTLRKSVKCLWNQVILIRPVWPPYIGFTIRSLDQLAEKLGFDHDLDDLNLYLSEKKEIKDLSIPLPLLDYIILKRHRMQKSIMPLAIRIFSEKPGNFTGRLATSCRIFMGENIKL